MNNVEIANIDDAEELIELQKAAFRKEAEIYNDFSISPITQTIEELKEEFSEKTFLRVLSEGKIIGSVRAFINEGTCFIGRLMVKPDFQNKGIGTSLMAAVEEFFKDAKRYELIVRHKREDNILFYQKRGYIIFKREQYSKSLEFVYMQKLKG